MKNWFYIYSVHTRLLRPRHFW